MAIENHGRIFSARSSQGKSMKLYNVKLRELLFVGHSGKHNEHASVKN